jgi:FHA domain-containing protein
MVSLNLDIPSLNNILSVLIDSEELILNRAYFQKNNNNFLASPYAFDEIAEEIHCKITKKSGGQFFLSDPDKLGKTYLNGIQIPTFPINLPDKSAIQIPYRTAQGVVSLDVKIQFVADLNIPSSLKTGIDSSGPSSPSGPSPNSQVSSRSISSTSIGSLSAKKVELTHDMITKKAYEIFEQHESYDLCVWLLAEADLRLEKAFSAKNRPLITQRIKGPVELVAGLLIEKPTEDKIRDLAKHIHEKYSPSLEDLHWLLAERTLLYEQVLTKK